MVKDAAESCETGIGGASFTASTKVLLASGKAVPIASLKLGQMVLATNVKTGKTQAETVIAVLVHRDTNLYDLRVRDRGGISVIDTTSNHLFFDPGVGGGGGRWMKAGALKYGTHLRTPSTDDDATVLGNGNTRVPDELNATTIGEVKNVAYQYLSSQLSDDVDYA